MDFRESGNLVHETDGNEKSAPSIDAITDTVPSQTRQKIVAIRHACLSRSVEALSDLAVSEAGLISDELRRQAWPILLGSTHTTSSKTIPQQEIDWRKLPQHRDEHQVALDVDRSFIYYPKGQSSLELKLRKEELSDLIIEVLRRQPYLCYFQGYHDICQIILLVLSPAERAPAAAFLSVLRIRDFMLPTLAPALSQLQLIPFIILAANPKLYQHISQTQPYFALSGMLTMYAHEIQEYSEIARLFDVLLAKEAVFSLYMFAQIVLNRASELFEIDADETDVLHSVLSKVPSPMDIEKLIADTVQLFEQYPPTSLNGWWRISFNSVLRTTQDPTSMHLQTLEDGRIWFVKQVREMQTADQRKRIRTVLKRYKRPISTIGIAVLVGVVAYYLRKPQGALSQVPSSLRRWL